MPPGLPPGWADARACVRGLQVLAEREASYGQLGVEISSSLGPVQPGAYYLQSVDDMGRRQYSRKAPGTLGVGKAEPLAAGGAAKL